MIAERLPVVATCAEELAAMQCAALSCLGAPLTAYACVQLPAAGLSIEGIQGANVSFIHNISRVHIWSTSRAATSGALEQCKKVIECVGTADSYIACCRPSSWLCL